MSDRHTETDQPIDFLPAVLGSSLRSWQLSICIASLLSAGHAAMLLRWYFSIAREPQLELNFWILGFVVIGNFGLNAFAILLVLDKKNSPEATSISLAIVICFLEFLVFYFPMHLLFPKVIEDATLLFFCLDAGFVFVAGVQTARMRHWAPAAVFVPLACTAILLATEFRYWFGGVRNTTLHEVLDFFPMLIAGLFFACGIRSRTVFSAWSIMFSLWAIVDFIGG